MDWRKSCLFFSMLTSLLPLFSLCTILEEGLFGQVYSENIVLESFPNQESNRGWVYYKHKLSNCTNWFDAELQSYLVSFFLVALYFLIFSSCSVEISPICLPIQAYLIQAFCLLVWDWKILDLHKGKIFITYATTLHCINPLHSIWHMMFHMQPKGKNVYATNEGPCLWP